MTPTPGPWTMKRAEVRSDGEFDYAIVSPSGQVIAEVFGRTAPADFPPAEANAHLIAAAPDLLAACKAALDESRYVNAIHSDIREEMEAAIAKAEATS